MPETTEERLKRIERQNNRGQTHLVYDVRWLVQQVREADQYFNDYVEKVNFKMHEMPEQINEMSAQVEAGRRVALLYREYIAEKDFKIMRREMLLHEVEALAALYPDKCATCEGTGAVKCPYCETSACHTNGMWPCPACQKERT